MSRLDTFEIRAAEDVLDPIFFEMDVHDALRAFSTLGLNLDVQHIECMAKSRCTCSLKSCNFH